MAICPHCGREVPDDAIVCPYCGAQLSEDYVVCGNCGRLIPADATGYRWEVEELPNKLKGVDFMFVKTS